MKLLQRNAAYRIKILKKTIAFVAISLVLALNGYTQDIHLTQFNYSPLLLNPANTGNFYGDWRAAINYRNQWASTNAPYSTAVVSADKQFSFFNQKIGAGLFFVNDATGGFTKNKLYLSGSYFYNLNENRFTGGLQIGVVFNSPTTSTWNIYNDVTGQHDDEYTSSQSIEKGIYPDINLGFLWQRDIGIFEPEAGVALAHLNMPNQSVMNGTDKIGLTSTVHGSVKTKFNDEIYITPTFMLALKNTETVSVIGSDVGYNLLGNRSSVKRLFLGVYMRNGMASELSDLSMLVGTTVGRLDIALNYDINMTSLSNTKHTSTFEISLIYKSISTVLNSYSIPCERF